VLSESDRQGIEHVRTALREAILGGDAEAYAACYTADGFVMHQDTPYVQGTAAIKEHTQELLGQVAEWLKARAWRAGECDIR